MSDNPYEDVNGKTQIKTAMKQAPKESSTPVSVTNIMDLYAVVQEQEERDREGERNCNKQRRSVNHANEEEKHVNRDRGGSGGEWGCGNERRE